MRNFILYRNKNYLRDLLNNNNNTRRNITTAYTNFSEQNANSEKRLFSKFRSVFKKSDYEFLKKNMCQKKNVLRKYSMTPVQPKTINYNPMLLRNLMYFEKEYVPSVYKSTLSEVSIKNQKPPIREPNMPERNIKKDDKKKEKKDKKPVIYTSESIPEIESSKASLNDVRQVFRHKWGVKLLENISTPSNVETNIKNEPFPLWSVNYKLPSAEDHISESNERLNSNKLRLTLVSKGDEIYDESYVKRPQQKQDHFYVDENFAYYSNVSDEVGQWENEYYIPHEINNNDVTSAWRDLATKSTARRDQGDEPVIPDIQQVDSVFIRPEPPAPKLDVKSVKTLDGPKTQTSLFSQKQHFSTCKDPVLSVSAKNESQLSSSKSENKAAVPNTKLLKNNVKEPSAIALPTRPLTPTKFSHDPLKEDDEFLNDFKTAPDKNLNLGDKIIQNMAKKQPLKNSNELKVAKGDNVKNLEVSKLSLNDKPSNSNLKNSKNSKDSVNENKRVLLLQQFSTVNQQGIISKQENPSETKIHYNVDSEIVKVEGDPYPYNVEHFNKWRAPPMKAYNIHIWPQNKNKK